MEYNTIMYKKLWALFHLTLFLLTLQAPILVVIAPSVPKPTAVRADYKVSHNSLSL